MDPRLEYLETAGSFGVPAGFVSASENCAVSLEEDDTAAGVGFGLILFEGGFDLCWDKGDLGLHRSPK